MLLALLAVIDAAPKAWTVDATPLPPKAAAEYRFTLRFEFADGTSAPFGVVAPAGAGADDMAAHVSGNFRTRQGWTVTRTNLTVTFHGVDGKPLRRLTAEGDGSKPTVRWEFAPPPKK